jgi:hypothetical protein
MKRCPTSSVITEIKSLKTKKYIISPRMVKTDHTSVSENTEGLELTLLVGLCRPLE